MPIVVAVIDDDEAVRDSTRAMLETYGYSVRVYENANEFLLYTGEQHDCLIVDHNMPGMSGLELVSLMQQRANATPALLITGRGSPAIAQMAAALRVPYLTKPVPEDLLIAQLNEVLAQDAPAQRSMVG